MVSKSNVTEVYHYMKCPFRTITGYTKKQNYYGGDGSGNPPRHYSKIEPCNEVEAHNKIIDFAECLKADCPYYVTTGTRDKCLKAET